MFGVFIAAVAMFTALVVSTSGQDKTCEVTLKVIDANTKTEIPDAYAEAYVSARSTTFHALPNATMHTFRGLNSGFHSFSVQKRGYKVSKYAFHLDCNRIGANKALSIVVPLHEGLISENENVSPKQEDGPSGSDKFSGPLSDADIARLFNYLNYDATELGAAKYPAAARAVKASGVVLVHVIVNEAGQIESAEAVSGHPLLRMAAKQAAAKSTFKPTLVAEKAIKRQGFIAYSFVL